MKYVQYEQEDNKDKFLFPNLPFTFDGFFISKDIKESGQFGKLLAMRLDEMFKSVLDRYELKEKKNG